MKKGVLLAFFLTIPLFSCAKVTYYNVTVEVGEHCKYSLIEKTAADNKDFVINFTTDFGYILDPNLDDLFYLTIGGIPLMYVKDKPDYWSFENNVLTIKARVITGDILVHADTVVDEYTVTCNYGANYTHSGHISEAVAIDMPKDSCKFDVTTTNGSHIGIEKVILVTQNEHVDVSQWRVDNDQLIIPSNQLGCDITFNLQDA